MNAETATYFTVVANGEWLEDRYHGRFSRFAINEEESVWVDHDNEEIVSDPLETLSEEESEEDAE